MNQVIDRRAPDRPADVRPPRPRPGWPASSTAGGPKTSARATLQALLAAALLAVAVLTWTPEGTGWSWGSPVTELSWYASGLDSAATLQQLLGNLGLLVVPAALAVLLWPSLGRPSRLVAAALGTGAVIELLQWLLPLGRVAAGRTSQRRRGRHGGPADVRCCPAPQRGSRALTDTPPARGGLGAGRSDCRGRDCL